MHNPHAEQVRGLRRQFQSFPTKFVAFTSIDLAHAESPLLWNLCECLASMRLSVATLDGTTHEDHRTAGLAHLIAGVAAPHSHSGAHSPHHWMLMASGMGFHHLLHSRRSVRGVLQEITHLLPDVRVVVVYSDAHDIARLLGGTHTMPLVPFTPDQHTMSRALRMVEHLYRFGGLQAMLLGIPETRKQVREHIVHQALMGLQQDIIASLGWSARGLCLNATLTDDLPREEVRNLALDLLEKGFALDIPFPDSEPAATPFSLSWRH